MNPTPTSLNEFQNYLSEHSIKHFSAKEVLFLGNQNKNLNLNTAPPFEVWGNIIPTLRILDKARNIVGPIKLISIYRTPEYNKAISGAKFSEHCRFTACDCVPLNTTVKHLHYILNQFRLKGEFYGGLGLYDTFVHIDTRGYNASWIGK